MTRSVRTQEELLAWILRRLRLVERRLGRTPTGGGGGPDLPDTGWVDLSPFLLAGFTATGAGFLGRQVGPMTHLRGAISGTWPLGTATTDFCGALPVQWRPAQNEWGAGFVSGNSLSIIMRPAGTMGASNRMILAATAGMQFSVHYFTG